MKHLLLIGLALMVTVGCFEKDDDDSKTIVLEMFKLSEPNWGIWDKPGAPQALYQGDAVGDNPSFPLYGSTTDWTLLEGTCDWKFVYIKTSVQGELDVSGNALYVLFVDVDKDGLQGPGDLVLEYDELYGYRVDEGIEIGPQESGSLQYAIPRSLLNGSFLVMAYIVYFDGLDWLQGDRMPDVGNTAEFQY